MADEKKQNSSSSSQEQKGNINEGSGGQRGAVIKGQIPDFKYSAPVPDKPNTTTTDKVK